MGEIAHVRREVGCQLSRPSQVGDDVPHAVVGEEEEFAARLRKVVDPVARVKNLQNHRLVDSSSTTLWQCVLTIKSQI